MVCRFCREKTPFATKPIICKKCRANLQYLVEKMEDPEFEVKTSVRCAGVIANIEFNMKNGGHVPQWYVDREFAKFQPCEQCGATYKCYNKGKVCSNCKKLSKAWSGHVSRGSHHLTSDRMEELLMMYCERKFNGLAVPRNAEVYIRSLEPGEFERLRKAKKSIDLTNQQKIDARIKTWLNT